MSRMRAVDALTRAMRDPAPPAPGAGEEEGRPVYLHPGQMIVASRPHLISTVLGSCVAVCLFDRGRGVGGINHFLLPSGGVGPAGNRIGTTAMPALLHEMQRLGCRPADLEARVYGGACVLAAFRGRAAHLGDQNAETAVAHLRAGGIRIVEQDTGGDHGRKLHFHTDTGTVSVRRI